MQEFGTRPNQNKQTVYTDQFNTNTLTITGLVFNTSTPVCTTTEGTKSDKAHPTAQKQIIQISHTFLFHRIQYIQSINIRTFSPHRYEWKVKECNSVAVIVVEIIIHDKPFLSSCTSNSAPADPSSEAPCLSRREMSKWQKVNRSQEESSGDKSSQDSIGNKWKSYL